eukprot:jgi/Chlat1/6241/Chrsp44S05768
MAAAAAMTFTCGINASWLCGAAPQRLNTRRKDSLSLSSRRTLPDKLEQQPAASLTRTNARRPCSCSAQSRATSSSDMHASTPKGSSDFLSNTRPSTSAGTGTSSSQSMHRSSASRLSNNDIMLEGQGAARMDSATGGPRICILGGGFGGLYTALKVDALYWPRNTRPQVTLVDQSERFIFKPLLYELLNHEVKPWEVAPRFNDLLASTGVKFVQATVKSVRPGAGAGTVQLDNGQELPYDWLVLALGAKAKLSICPGAKEYACPFITLEDALNVDSRLTHLEQVQKLKPGRPPISVSVVGAGYSGIELAATIAERLGERGNVRVIDPVKDFLPGVSREGVPDSPVTIDVQSSDGSYSTLLSDLVLWTVGTESIVPESGNGRNGEAMIPLNPRGRAETDATLRVRGNQRVFALGDSATAVDENGRYLPSTAQVAFQQADYVGWNLWSAINGKPLLPFKYQHLGDMMTLGKMDGAVRLSIAGNLELAGAAGGAVRKLAYLYRLPTNQHKLKVGLSWLTRPLGLET